MGLQDAGRGTVARLHFKQHFAVILPRQNVVLRGAGLGQIGYGQDGKVYTCDEGRMIGKMGDPIFEIGEVQQTTYKDLVGNPTVRAFEEAVARISGCMECHLVTGEFDYFMLVRTRDSDSFNRLHAEQLLYLPGVRQVRSFLRAHRSV